MDPEERREIARMGGEASYEYGHAHEWDSREAREAGHRGGMARWGRRYDEDDDDRGYRSHSGGGRESRYEDDDDDYRSGRGGYRSSSRYEDDDDRGYRSRARSRYEDEDDED
jgi:general stress protein YciG